MPYEQGIPSHDTLGGTLGQIEPSAFEHCSRAQARRVQEKTDGEVVALDGKTVRGSRDQLHLVEAWATGQEIMLGQRRSEGGSNEIETIPRLLELLALEGCIVTIDAMDCQTDVAGSIRGNMADYMLRLKENQAGLRADVEQLFERRLDLKLGPDYTDVDEGHGRVETRSC